MLARVEETKDHMQFQFVLKRMASQWQALVSLAGWALCPKSCC